MSVLRGLGLVGPEIRPGAVRDRLVARPANALLTQLAVSRVRSVSFSGTRELAKTA